MERQNHGFAEESHIRSVYCVDKYDDNYISQWDGITRLNNVDFSLNNSLIEYIQNRFTNPSTIIPVSIKTKMINCAVEMGDLMRNAMKEEDFILTVGFWEGANKNVVQRNFLYIPQQEWVKNFPFELATKMVNIFKDHSITNDADDDLKWKQISSKYKKEWNNNKTGIDVHFKRDHKSQKRVQCSIKKEYFTHLIQNYSIELNQRQHPSQQI